MSDETPLLLSPRQGSPVQAENARTKGGLLPSLPAPHHGLGPNLTMLTDTNPPYHPEILIDDNWHHEPCFFSYSDLNNVSIPTTPNQNAIPSPMPNSPNEAPPHDSRFFGVGLHIEGPGTLTDITNLGFQPWDQWPATGPAIGPAMDDSMAILSPATQFGSTPALECTSNFEPLMPVFESHGLHQTQEWPHSPTPSSNATTSPFAGPAASLYGGGSRTPGLYYNSPASPTTNLTQLDFQAEPALAAPGLRTRQTSLATPGLPKQFSKRRTSSYSGSTRTSIEAQDPASGYLTPSTQSSSMTLPNVNRPEASTASSPEHRGHKNSRISSKHSASRSKAQPIGITQPASQKQRNRAAATKCRAKAKVATAQLEATERDLDAENQGLRAMEKSLRDEWLTLKNEVLSHGHCDSELIQQYLAISAQKMAGGKGWGGQSTALSLGSSGTASPRKPSWQSTEPEAPPGMCEEET